MPARLLIFLSAAIIFTLGAIHLLYTFRGPKLKPRDAELEARLKAVPPVISRETSMWKAWLGFNASHAFGAMFFGALYAHLALAHSGVLFQSYFLSLLGLALLSGYLLLAKLYWFSIPFRGILLATACYIAGLTAAWS